MAKPKAEKKSINVKKRLVKSMSIPEKWKPAKLLKQSSLDQVREGATGGTTLLRSRKDGQTDGRGDRTIERDTWLKELIEV